MHTTILKNIVWPIAQTILADRTAKYLRKRREQRLLEAEQPLQQEVICPPPGFAGNFWFTMFGILIGGLLGVTLGRLLERPLEKILKQLRQQKLYTVIVKREGRPGDRQPFT